MTTRNVELPSVQDIGANVTEQVILQIALVDAESMPYAGFYQVANSLIGNRQKSYVLTDAPQIITLVPTDEIAPNTWYLVGLFRFDAKQYYRTQLPSFVSGDPDPLPWGDWIGLQEQIDGKQIHESRLLPTQANDADITVYDAATQRWIAKAPQDAGVGGDMHSSIYDPLGIEADAFDFAYYRGTLDAGTFI